MVTLVPVAPPAGANDEMVGGGGGGVLVTVNGVVLVPVPAGVVTAIGPVVALLGTVAVMVALLVMVKGAGVPLKVTVVAPPRSDPVMVTLVPVAPPAGANDETTGSGTQGDVLRLTAFLPEWRLRSSTASTSTRCFVAHSSPEKVHDVEVVEPMGFESRYAV
jgi:hypothetical protein